MVTMLSCRYFCSGLLISVSLLTLTGCPGSGDRMRFDETARASRVGEKVCFSVSNVKDYKPAIISINARNTISLEKKFTDNPSLPIVNGLLCIPPSFYRFPNKGQFIVEYVLTSEKNEDKPRSVVVTLEIKNGRIYNVTPTEREIFLPYCRDVVDKTSGTDITGACQQ